MRYAQGPDESGASGGTGAVAAPADVLLEPRPRPRLLVVDDQPLNIQALLHTFSADHEVLSAGGGEAALELCRTRIPDLVLLDVSMPGIDGYEVCERLKADVLTRDIPVIFVTGEDSGAAAVRSLAAGAVDLIVKPFSPVLARARVRTHLMVRQQAERLRALSCTDALTGLSDRRTFDARLQSALRRAHRSATPLSMILVDIDRFDRYNAQLGQQAGDDCLRLIAAGLRTRLQRHGNLLARHGAQTLACLLPQTPGAGALALAEALGQRVRDLNILHPDHATGSHGASLCTISIGVSTCEPQRSGCGEDLPALAMTALRRAQAEGGDRAAGTVCGGCAWQPGVDAAKPTR